MQRAYDLAVAAGQVGEVPVGAVLLDPVSGEIVSEGANAPIALCDPTAHAEIIALRAAARIRQNYRLPGLHLYVTLEPCAMCAGAISQARISRLIFAAEDKKGGAVINGPRYFQQNTCHSAPDIQQDLNFAPKSAALLRAFFKSRRR